MAEKNVTEVLVTPVVPTVVDNQELTVYVPIASSEVAGIVKPDAGDFNVADDGKLSLIKGDKYSTLEDALNAIAQVAQDVTVLAVDKQNKADNGLETESKFVVGAINEIWQTLQDVDILDVVTKSTTDLINYYVKSETYSQAEINELIANVKSTVFRVVPVLPAEGEDNVIYLVPKIKNPNSAPAGYGPFYLKYGSAMSADDWKYVKVNGVQVEDNYQLKNGDKIEIKGFGLGLAPYSSFVMFDLNGTTYKTSQDITLANVDLVVGEALNFADELVTLNINYAIADIQDTYDEWVWVVDPNTDPTTKKWEHIGTTEIDLSNYPTIDQMNTAIATAISQAQSGITALDLSYADVNVTYDTTDGATLSSTARITTGDTHSDVPVESELPIFGDNNDITIDANTAGTGLVIKGAEILELNVVSGATNGTLTAEQLAFLQNKKGNMIMIDHELYRLGSDGYNPGFLTYYHVGITGTTQHIKTLSVTISTKAWTIVVKEVQEALGKAGSITLLKSDWLQQSGSTSYYQTISFAANEGDAIFFTPATVGARNIVNDTKLFVSSTTTGMVTFTAFTQPAGNCTLNFFIARGE